VGAGREVLVEVDVDSSLLVGNPPGIFGQQVILHQIK